MRPNLHNRLSIVFVMRDQLSEKSLEATEKGHSPMPNVERLRQTGASFTQVVTSSPVCCEPHL